MSGIRAFRTPQRYHIEMDRLGWLPLRYNSRAWRGGVCGMAVALCLFGSQPSEAHAGPGPSLFSTSLGFEYRTLYFWRGVGFYGDAGVLYPYIQQSIGDFSILVGLEIGEDLLGQGSDYQEKWRGVNISPSYHLGLFDGAFAVDVAVWYLWYPFSQEVNERDGVGSYREDIVTTTLGLSLPKVLFSPYVRCEHMFWVETFGGTRQPGPDIYVEVGGEHTFELPNDWQLRFKLSAGYFNYPLSASWNTTGGDSRGITDVSMGAVVDVPVWDSWRFFSGVTYAFVPDVDFYAASGESLQHRVWWHLGSYFSL